MEADSRDVRLRALILLFALGTCLCQQLTALPVLWPLLLAALTGAAIAWRAHRTGRYFIMFCALGCVAFTAGLAWADWRAELRLADALTRSLEGQDVWVSGYIADLPDRNERSQRFQFLAEERPPGVPQRLLLSWYAGRGDGASMPPLRAGEAWRLQVRLRRPHGNLNPNGFDYEAWLFERGIRAVGYVRSPASAERTATLAPGVLPRIQRARQIVRERFEQALPGGEWVGVLSALAVGDQSAVPAAQWRLFSQTGVTHLMSISGGHVTLFAALFALLLRFAWSRVPALCLRLPAQKAAVLGGALAAFVYVLLAGFGVPAQRTLYMLLAVCAGLWLGRSVNAWRCLALGLLAVLLYDPWASLSPGFWLSFGAVAVLLWAGLSMGQQAEGIAHWLRVQWRAQWAIVLLSLPLLLGLFQQFSLVSPLANALAIPLISAVVTPLALLFAALPLPSLAALAHWLLSLLMSVLQWFAALPIATWQQAAPPVWLVGIAALAAFWTLMPRGTPARHVAWLAVLPLLAWTPTRPAPGDFRATIIDVGQGLAAHVQTASHDLLFDTGPQYTPESDSGERVIHPFLRAQGVKRLDRLIVSHDDIDHAGGAVSLSRLMPVALLLSSMPPERAQAIRATAREKCVAGQGWEMDGVRFEMLHPGHDTQGLRDNDRSCVMRVSSASDSLLLTGDIEVKAEGQILQAYAGQLRSAVLVAPHHGSRSSSQQSFIDAVGAREVIFTSGYRNRFGHPHPAVVARYAASGARMYRSDRDGAVIRREGRTGTARAERRRYWHGQ